MLCGVKAGGKRAQKAKETRRRIREMLERVAPITEMLRTAGAIDPEVAELWPQEPDPRHTVHSAAATAMVAKPGVRDGVTAAYAADVLFGVLSPELYLVFVRDRGCRRSSGRPGPWRPYGPSSAPVRE